jgi:RHS repeat-associated protein
LTPPWLAKPLIRIAYSYDGFDRLVERKQTSYQYPDGGEGTSGEITESYVIEKRVYDGDHVVLDFSRPDWSTTFSLEHRYLYGPAVDQVLAQEDVQGPQSLHTVLWMLADNQGTVHDLVDSSGQLREHYNYDAFGQLYGYGSVPLTRYLYTGRDYDVATKLEYNRERWYDANSGRWLTQDPIGFDAGDANLYRYAGNDPTNVTDPSGLYEQDIHFGMTYYIGLAVGLGSGTNFKANGKTYNAAYMIAWADQYTDVFSSSEPFAGTTARSKFHFRGGSASGGVVAGGSAGRAVAGQGIQGKDLLLFGVGLHAYQDSFSHAGYGPRLGHASAGHSPDYAFNDVDTAMQMAEGTYHLLAQWKSANGGGAPDMSFAQIQGTLRRLLSLPGSEEKRMQRWATLIQTDFGGFDPFQGMGGNSPWNSDFRNAINKVNP